MEKKEMAEYASKIQMLEKQLSEITKQQDEIKNSISSKKSAFEQLQKEQDDIQGKIKTIGFFNFKERKPHKLELSKTRKLIKETETSLEELNGKADAITQQAGEVQDKINETKIEQEKKQQELQRMRIEQERKEKYKQDILSGAISYDNEVNMIANKIKEYIADLGKWHDMQEAYFRSLNMGDPDRYLLKEVIDHDLYYDFNYCKTQLNELLEIKRDPYTKSLIDECEKAKMITSEAQVHQIRIKSKLGSFVD